MPTRYPIIGDLHKPFHLPECECDTCEQWRADNYPKEDAEMTDTEAEKIGREWAAKRGRVPLPITGERLGQEWHWGMSSPYNSGDDGSEVLPDSVYDLLPQGPRAYSTEAAAYAALGRAVVRGREVFACVSTTPKERPILFSAPMVQAIIAGRKSQTRRVVKPQPDAVHAGEPYWHVGGFRARTIPPCGSRPLPCPYGRVGDRLWVQESYGLTYIGASTPAYEAGTGCRCTCFYSANGACRVVSLTAGDVRKLENRKSDRLRLQPGRFMYRSCSRLTLEITGVRVERLQAISHNDALAEGVEYDVSEPDGSPLFRFRALWEKINGYGSWEANPWVWVIEFKRVNQ